MKTENFQNLIQLITGRDFLIKTQDTELQFEKEIKLIVDEAPLITIADIKAEQEKKVTDLLNKCSVFFAFSNEQFNESKTPLQEGEKYVSMGAGGYLPKGQVDNYLQGMKDIKKWYKEAVKSNKARKENIIYELANHEAYYTGSITATLEALGDDYTAEEVRAVYKEESKKQSAEY